MKIQVFVKLDHVKTRHIITKMTQLEPLGPHVNMAESAKAKLNYIWHYRLWFAAGASSSNSVLIKITSSIKQLKILLRLSKLLNANVKMDLVEIHVRRHLAVMPICAKMELFVWSTVTLINACASQDTMANIVRKGPAMKTFTTLMVHLPILMAYVTHMAHVRINWH